MIEQIDNTITKLVKMKIQLDELELIKPHIGTEEFNNQYELTEAIRSYSEQEGRKDLQSMIGEAIDEHNRHGKKIKVVELKSIGIKAFAACFLLACGITVIANTQGYNVEKKYTKVYIKK